ncbi:hypothetical protein CAEBREN_09398 [Caenorhabditis brenneri]|uniref:SPK domain-containing protein n=1 Tax=Caenorhabditis brenneri TaxID=135651 RepID=G0MU64_CAEBE|nr:hypothetical protein CAEBREN_09398 [Caenorhabditis brenneri]
MKKKEFKQILQYAENKFEEFPDQFLDFPEFCKEYAQAHRQNGTKEIEESFQEWLIGSEITDDIEQRANALYRFKILVPRKNWAPFQDSNVGAAQFYTDGRMAEFDGHRIVLGEPNPTDLFDHLDSVASTSLETKSVEELAESFLEWRKSKKNCPIEAEYVESRILQICKEVQRPKAKVLESPHRSARILMMTATPIKDSYWKKLKQSATVLVDKKTGRMTKYVSFDNRFNFEKDYDKIQSKHNENVANADNGQEEKTSSEKDKKVKSSAVPASSEAVMNTNDMDSSSPSSSRIPPHRPPKCSGPTSITSRDGEKVLKTTQIQTTEPSLPVSVEDFQPSNSSSSEAVKDTHEMDFLLLSTSGIPPHRPLPSFRPSPIAILKKGKIQETTDTLSSSVEDSQPTHSSSSDTNAGAQHPQPTKHVVNAPPNLSETHAKKKAPMKKAAAPPPPKPVSGDRIFDYSPNMDVKIKGIFKSAAKHVEQAERTAKAEQLRPEAGRVYASPEVARYFIEKEKRLEEAAERLRNPQVAPAEVAEKSNLTEITQDMDVGCAMEITTRVPYLSTKDKLSILSKNKLSTASKDKPSKPSKAKPSKKSPRSKEEKPYASFLNSITHFPPGMEKAIGLVDSLNEESKIVPKPSILVETVPATMKRPSKQPVVVGPVILSEPPPTRPDPAHIDREEFNRYKAFMVSIADKTHFPLTLKQIERRYKASRRPIIRNLSQKIPHYHKFMPTCVTDKCTTVRLMFITQTPVPEATQNNFSEFTFNLDGDRKIVEVQGKNLLLTRVKPQIGNVLAEVDLSDTEEEVRVPEVVVISDSDDEADDLPTAGDFDDHNMTEAGGDEDDEEVKEDIEADSESVKMREENSQWKSVVSLLVQKARSSSVFLEWKNVYDEIKEKHPEVEDSAEEALNRIKKDIFHFPLKWNNITDRYYILYMYRIELSEEEQQRLGVVGRARFDKYGRLVELCSRGAEKIQFGVTSNSIIMNHLKELAGTLRETKTFESLAEMFMEWRCRGRNGPLPPIDLNYLAEKYKDISMLIQSYNTISLTTRIRMLWITGIRLDEKFKDKLKASGRVEVFEGFVWKFKPFKLSEEFDNSVEKFNRVEEEEEDDGDYGDPTMGDEMDYMENPQNDPLDYDCEAASIANPTEEPTPERSEASTPPVSSNPKLGQGRESFDEDSLLGTSDTTPAEVRTPEKFEESSPSMSSVPNVGLDNNSFEEVNVDPMLEASDATRVEETIAERSEKSSPPATSVSEMGLNDALFDQVNEDPLTGTTYATSEEQGTPERSDESSPPVSSDSKLDHLSDEVNEDPLMEIFNETPENLQQSSSQISPISEIESLLDQEDVDKEEEKEATSEVSQESAISTADLLRHQEDSDNIATEDAMLQVSAPEETQEPSSIIPSTSDPEQLENVGSPNQKDQAPMAFEGRSSSAIPELSSQVPSTSGTCAIYQVAVTHSLNKVITEPVPDVPEEVSTQALEPQLINSTSSIFGSLDPIRLPPRDTAAASTVTSEMPSATVKDAPKKSRRSRNPSSTTRKTLSSTLNTSVDASIDGPSPLSPLQHSQDKLQVVKKPTRMSLVEGQLVPITKKSNTAVEAAQVGSTPQSSGIDPAIQKLILNGYFSKATSSKSAVSQKDVVETRRPSTSDYKVEKLTTSQTSVTSTPQPSTSQLPSHTPTVCCPLPIAAKKEKPVRRRTGHSGREKKRIRKEADDFNLSSTPNLNVQSINTSQVRLTSTPQFSNKNPTVPDFLQLSPITQLTESSPKPFSFIQSSQAPNLPLLTPAVTKKPAQKRGRVSTEKPAVPEKRARQEVEQHGGSILMQLLTDPTFVLPTKAVAPKPAAASSKNPMQTSGPSASAVKLIEPNDIAREKCEAVMAELRKDLACWEQEDEQAANFKALGKLIDRRNEYNVLIERIEYYFGEFYELLLMSTVSKDVEKDISMTIIQVLTMINGESQVKSSEFKKYFTESSKPEVVYDKMWRAHSVLKDSSERSHNDNLKQSIEDLIAILF